MVSVGVAHQFRGSEALTKFVIGSILLHILLIFGFYFSNQFKLLKGSEHKINIASASIRVDIVEMPKFTPNELKVMQKEIIKGDKEIAELKEAENAIQAAKDSDFLVKQKKKSFLDMMKKMSRKKVKVKKIKIKKKKIRGERFGKF